jgi:hypothetical protein
MPSPFVSFPFYTEPSAYKSLISKITGQQVPIQLVLAHDHPPIQALRLGRQEHPTLQVWLQQGQHPIQEWQLHTTTQVKTNARTQTSNTNFPHAFMDHNHYCTT